MNKRSGFVGLVGLPNAGKSTLVNSLIGEKVGIISKKPQTTRQRVIGIYNDSDSQIMFVDSPGLVHSEGELNSFLKQELKKIVEDSDVLVAMLNIDESSPEFFDEILKLCEASKKPWMCVISKTDLPHPQRCWILEDKIKKYKVPLVKTAIGRNSKSLNMEFLTLLKELLPFSKEDYFDESIYTTQRTRDLVAEIVREKCFEFLHQEIPYGLAVQVKKFDENSGPTVKIYTDIIVSKENHRCMVVGSKASTIKQIGTMARKEIQKLIPDRKIYLDCHVKLKKNWVKDKSFMKELGYVVPSNS